MIAASVAASVLAVGGPGFAGAETTGTGASGAVIHIEEVKGALKFVGPSSVHVGEQLEVVNETNAKKVGPHTFSLVTQGSLPKTAKARQLCFTPNHICKAIAIWHGVKGEGAPTKNPATAGAEGWSTMGTVHKKGDSWFTGNKPKASFTQTVTAVPTTLYYMCAVHPWMHGKITVLAPGA